MPAGLSRMYMQEVASSVGDVVGHLLCRGRFMMDDSSRSSILLCLI